MVTRALLLVVIAACAPDLEDTTTLVTEPRLLAARFEPAEVAPQGSVESSALWAGPDGTLADAPLAWAFCVARKGITEPGPVTKACLVDESPALVPFGVGDSASGVVPANACRQFGPDAPDVSPDEPAGRPADPDGTGGFYQPVRVRVEQPESFTLGEVRIGCGLPGATPAQASEFRATYVPNTNPAIETMLRADSGATLVALEVDAAATTTIAAGQSLTLAVHWPACTSAPCAGSEPYVWFDPRARTLRKRREAMRLSWFASAGAFELGHSGRAEDEADTSFADGVWTAPHAPGPAFVWIVLRDDRGGTTWATLRFNVE